MTPSPYPVLTEEEGRILETKFKLFNESSFTALSNNDRKNICKELGKGWEWNTLEDKGIGENRLRAWWRRRSTLLTKSDAQLKSKKKTKPHSTELGKSATSSFNDIKSVSNTTRPGNPKEFTSMNKSDRMSSSQYDRKTSSSTKIYKKEEINEQLSQVIQFKPLQMNNLKGKQFRSGPSNLNQHARLVTKIEPENEQETGSMRNDSNNNTSLLKSVREGVKPSSNNGSSRLLDSAYTNEELHTIQATEISESSDTIFFQSTRLKIGTWIRTSDSRLELVVFYSPSEEGFVFWTSHEDKFFRIILPLFALSSLKIFESTSTSNLVLLFTRSSPSSTPYFEVSNSDSQKWNYHSTGDFTQDRQASTNEIYSLEVQGVDGVNEALQQIFLSLLDTPNVNGSILMKEFLEKVWWGDWNESELSVDGLIESMGLLIRGIEGSTASLEYKNSKRSGGSNLILNSVYYHLMNESLESGGTRMEEVRDSLNGKNKNVPTEPESGLYEHILLPSSSPTPSLYHSRSSSLSDVDYEFISTPLNPFETFSDSYEHQINNKEFENQQIQPRIENQSENAYGFFSEEYYPQYYETYFGNHTSTRDPFHEFPFNLSQTS